QEATVAIEQLLRSITAQPVFEDLAVGGITPRVGYRDLVRSPEVLDLLPVDFLRSGPAFRAAQDNHGPARPLAGPVFSAGLQLDLAETVHRPVQGISHGPVHRNRVLTLDEQRLVAVAPEEISQFRVRHARQQSGVGDLVAVKMQDRQNRAVHLWVEELVGVPGCRQRSRLRLPVADDTGHDEVGVVESGAEGMDKRVAEFAAFVDRTRRLWGDVARYTARKRKLAEQFPQSGLVLR